MPEAEATQAAPQETESDRWVQEIAVADGVNTDDLAGMADWFVNKLISFDEEDKRIKEQAEIRQAKIDARRTAVWRHYGGKARVAVAALLERKGGKGKSLDLESGRIGFRVSPVTAEYVSPEVVKRLAENFEPAATVYSEETKVIPKVDKRALKTAVDEYAKAHGGELPEGITLQGGEDKLYVQPPK